MSDLLIAVVAVLAGGVAAIAGFGIGSLLTPLVALRYGTKLAVAVVSGVAVDLARLPVYL